MKNVLVVCRFNQARSILIGALLRKLFPDLRVTTAGIEAIDNLAIPASTAEICLRWNLPNFDRHSKSIESTHSNQNWDAVLAVDELVFSRLQQGPFTENLHLLADYSNFPQSIPIDPTNLALEDFATELAKAAILSVRWAESLLNIQPSPINGYLCSLSTNLNDLNRNNGLYSDGSLLIDVQIQYPNFEFWNDQGFTTIFFNPRRLELDMANLEVTEAPKVLVSKFEIDIPELIFTSNEWRDFLISLSNLKQINLISFTDFSDSKNMANSYLGLINSSSNFLVGN